MAYQMFSGIIHLGNACSTECVGFNEISSSLQVCLNKQLSWWHVILNII